MYGKRLTFLYTSPYELVEYNVSGPLVNTGQVFLYLPSVQKKNIHDYICD